MNDLSNTPRRVNAGEAQRVIRSRNFHRRIPNTWKNPLEWKDEQKPRPKRRDARKDHDAICEGIESLIEAEPFELDGQTWTQPFSLGVLAECFGLPQRTFERRICEAPIRKRVKNFGQGKRLLLRVGDEGMTDYEKAQKMAGTWRFEVPHHQVSHNEFGCLCGLAKVWPDPWQKRILIYTIRRWGFFKSAVNFGIGQAKRIGATTPEERKHLYTADALSDHVLDVARFNMPDDLKVRWHDYPSLTIIRKFWYVAEEHFRDGMQDLSLACPDHPTWREAPADWALRA
ncbi:MAG: hypothetical protein GJ676_02460 [Rhodobacteraceae bacterium]|nr:hypothetical protein [Paracoccaceae bacterium]